MVLHRVFRRYTSLGIVHNHALLISKPPHDREEQTKKDEKRAVIETNL